MSLYSLIHDRKEIRDGFAARVSRPRIQFPGPVKAPPLSPSHRIVGAAFDYLLRFLLERLDPHARSSHWVAENGTLMIGVPQDDPHEIDPSIINQDPYRVRALTYLTHAQQQHDIYLRSGKVTNDLLLAGLRLAHLDVAYRAGPDRIDWLGLDSPDPRSLADLAALLALVDERAFQTTHTCILNPSFGAASELVGGADADLILDDALIDVKCTKEPRLDPRDFYQLVGYYFLYGLAGVSLGDSLSNHPMNWLGIYFARFGCLWKVPVESILQSTQTSEALNWFVATVSPGQRALQKLIRESRGPLAHQLADIGERAISQPKTPAKPRSRTR